MQEVMDRDYFNAVAAALGFDSAPRLFAAVGNGTLAALVVIEKLLKLSSTGAGAVGPAGTPCHKPDGTPLRPQRSWTKETPGFDPRAQVPLRAESGDSSEFLATRPKPNNL
jgi:hypothetical protein